ncbi:MAG: hypothetical protein HYU74_12490 [Dechloromonas sp.]|nr:hypothetical protein [Dechloromonas sp.]
MTLPVIIQDIIQVIGHTKTMALVQEFGGQELRPPRTEDSEIWAAFAEVIGERATKRFAEAFQGVDKMYIAFCEKAMRLDRNRKMIARYEKLIKEGHSGRGAVSILVREFRINYRQVEKIINSPLPEPSTVSEQGQLF